MKHLLYPPEKRMYSQKMNIINELEGGEYFYGTENRIKAGSTECTF